MPYALTIATPATRELVVDAMRGRADTLKRAATRASAELELDRTSGKDVRSRAVKLVTMLAQANELEALAVELEELPELALVEAGPGLRLIPIPDEPIAGDTVIGDLATPAAAAQLDAETAGPDDGLSPEAHALAAAAGLTDTILEDELGGAPEDEPTPADVVDVAALLLEDPTGATP